MLPWTRFLASCSSGTEEGRGQAEAVGLIASQAVMLNSAQQPATQGREHRLGASSVPGTDPREVAHTCPRCFLILSHTEEALSGSHLSE